MKITRFLTIAAALSVIAACGGGDSGGGGTATSTETKVAAAAAAKEAIGAAGETVLAALEPPAAMIIKGGVAKDTVDVEQTVECREGGSIGVTGPITWTCDGSYTTCTVSSANLTLAFNECDKSVTLTEGGTTYYVTLNSLAGGTTGVTLSGTLTRTGADTVSANAGGSITGTVGMTGDVGGTVEFTNSQYTVTGQVIVGGEGAEPTIGCTGTCSVTITEPASAAATQDCTLDSECNGCSS